MGQMNNLISLIIPCYNEEESIPVLHEELCRVSRQLSDYEFEFLFIDDGSSDRTIDVIRKLTGKDIRVKY